MPIKDSETNITNGQFYTPTQLAKFLVDPLIDKSGLKIFDPAYGEGSLLLASEKVCISKNFRYTLSGCDLFPSNGLLTHINQKNLKSTDFFDYESERTYDLIVLNPPYVRHHELSAEQKNRYGKKIDGGFLNKKSDLWVYFLVKSLRHLKRGGSIGAILPWSFLQADYSQWMRKKLSEVFEKIKVLGLTNKFFECTEQRVVLLWLQNYQTSNKVIHIGFSPILSKAVRYKKVSKEDWTSLYYRDHDIESIINTYISDYEFLRFDELAEVKIGIVTGADDYFILQEDSAIASGFNRKELSPIIRSSKEFCSLRLNGYIPNGNLIRIRNYAEHESYIKRGLRKAFNLRRHSLSRKPWYKIDVGKTADAFFPYRVRNIPYLIFNDSNLQCTNSVHRIYFKNKYSETERKWVQLSLLSVPGQLCLELYSKMYGVGVLKIEPRSLKNCIVYHTQRKLSETVYNEIAKLIQKNKREQAMLISTEYLSKKLNISNDLHMQSLKQLNELRQRRFRK